MARVQPRGRPPMNSRNYRSSHTSLGEWFLLMFMLALIFGGVAGFIWLIARRWL